MSRAPVTGALTWPLLTGLGLFSLLLWTPALITPLWGDDYVFLRAAQQARLEGLPWWQAFWPESPTQFWRPLSMDSYFRVLDTLFAGHPLAAHLLNAVIWLLACCALGIFARQLSIAMHWPHPGRLAVAAALVFSLSSVHFLPLHWVSAVNSSWLILWLSLAMALWVSMPRLEAAIEKIAAVIALLLLQALALWSKESAILLPGLLLCLSLFCLGHRKPAGVQLIAWLACVLLCLVWLQAYRQFTHPQESVYSLQLNAAVFKNLALLVAWLGNVPREALRLIHHGAVIHGLLWSLACFLPVVLAVLFYVLRLGSKRGSGLGVLRIQILATVVFVLWAYAPYLLLAHQSYAYYAAVSLTLPAILLARGLATNKRIAPVLLLCLSALINVQGSRLMDYPGLIGRAHWAEKQFAFLEAESLSKPLVLQVDNHHQFYAMGVAGLAWRLGFDERDIYLVDACLQKTEQILHQDGKGDFYWKSCNNLH